MTMIQLLRRIGFPPFKRTTSTRSHRDAQCRFTSNETLEARVLLAADTMAFLDNSLEAADVDRAGHPASLDALAILHSLSRGRSELMAHAGVANSHEATLAAQPEVFSTRIDEVVTVDDTDQVITTLNAVAPAMAATAEGEPGDIEIQVGADTFVLYNSLNGSLRVETTNLVTTLEMVSKSGIFTGDDAINLGGSFDIDTDTKIFKLAQDGFLNQSFGTVTQPGLTEEFLRTDLTINGSILAPDPDDPGRLFGAPLSDNIVKIRLQATDLNGAPVSELSFDDEFLVRVLTQDKRGYGLFPEGNEGVFSAYLDIVFDSNLAVADGNIVFSNDYKNATSGTITPGLIDEIGAVSTSTSPLDKSEYEVAQIRMRATGSGELTFIADAADELPNHQTLVFGGTAGVDAVDIEFVDSQSVTINDSPTAPDLVQFAKDITDSGTIFYGAAWCGHCTSQKEAFEDGQSYLPFVEVTSSDRTPNQIAIDNDITTFPTWVFADGTRLTGFQTLETLAERAGIAIPESNTPILLPIDDVDLLAGSPLHLPLDGYDPNNDGPLTYSVTTDNPDLVMTSLLAGNRSMEIDVSGYGKMVFELFDDKAPRVTDQITSLVEDGFYDGLTFHRILDNFVIQGGDPNGNGTGGPDRPDFADQYHVDLQHNQTGVLSMAKSQDDTNGSQFFITEGATRHLDFNHSIFGQLVEGESNRQSISNVAVEPGGRPTYTVTMTSVDLFDDIENGMLMLSAAEGASGTANVTVTVSDAEGHSTQSSFAVNVSPDTENGGPFLDDISEISTEANTETTYQLSSQDVEGDAVSYSVVSGSNADFSVDSENGLLTIIPDQDFVGVATATVRVRALNGSDTSDTYDSQRISVNVLPGKVSLDLSAGSDSGSSSSDNLTNQTELEFEVSDVADGALVELFGNGTKIGEGTAAGNSVTITTANLASFGDGIYEITATQTLGDTTSSLSDNLTIELDQTGPDGFTATPPDTALVGTPLTFDTENTEEGSVIYTLSGAPSSAGIDPNSGLLTWTPTISQAGMQSFDILATDAAGNTSAQSVDIDVEQNQLMTYRLKLTDTDGNLINAAIAGEEFLLQVYVEDLRTDALNAGVFSAYLDITYDDNAVSVNGDVEFSSNFQNVQFSDLNTAGLIDDTGATADTTPLGSGEFLLMSIPMIADGSGNAEFTADPADNLPSRETTLHGLGVGLSPDQMVFEGTSLEIASMTFANDDTFQIDEDSSGNLFNVLANDFAVPETRTLAVNSVSGSSNATVSINENQEIVYTPQANFAGTDTFTYEIIDNEGDTSSATVTVEVANVNDDPIANDDSFTVSEDQTNVEIELLNNDSSSPDQDEVLRITEVTQPANGSVQIAGNGTTVLFTPDPDFAGNASFSYTISDGNGGTANANVSVSVSEVNDTPIVFQVNREINEDTTLTITATELLENALPGGGEIDQTLAVVSVGGETGGTLEKNGDVVTFTPAQDFAGSLSFEYTVTDNGTTNGVADPRTASGVVTVVVNEVNDAPTAVADTASAQTGAGSISILVLENDTISPDENEVLSIISVSDGSADGTISIVGDTIEYTPADEFVEGTETFSYTISDGNGGESTATVTVTVVNFVAGGIKGSFSRANIEFAGIPIYLRGINNIGAEVTYETATDADGNFSFDTVTAGSYELATADPHFTTPTSVDNSIQTFDIELTADGTGDTEYNFDSRNLDPRFAIWETLSSHSDSGLYTSVNETNGHEWSQFEDGWEDIEMVDIQFSDDMSSLQVTISEEGQELTTTIDSNNREQVRIIGKEDDYRLVRIKGSRDDFDFQPTNGGGEGEAPRDQVFSEGLW
ncbi:MAG: tandem-95 repeat protein [Planctomycetaceae bacterium]|nr:tandem-95 repeat protein [Planctomycetaceae bacterium]